LIMLGGRLREDLSSDIQRRRLVELPEQEQKWQLLIAVSEGMLDVIEKAIAKLDTYSEMSWWRWLRTTG
jgi:hypothetical protein